MMISTESTKKLNVEHTKLGSRLSRSLSNSDIIRQAVSLSDSVTSITPVVANDLISRDSFTINSFESFSARSMIFSICT